MKKTIEERSEIFRNIAVVGDFALLNVAFIVTYLFVTDFHTQTLPYFPLATYIILANLCYIPCLLVFPIILHHREARTETIVGRIVGTTVFHLVIFVAIAGLMRVGNTPRTFIASFYILLFVLLPVWRITFRRMVVAIRSRGRNLRPVVLVGNGENISELNEVMSDVTYGYRVEGIFFNFGEEVDVSPTTPGYREEMSRLVDFLNESSVREVYCSLPSVCGDDIFRLINYCENNLIRFFSVPNVRNYVKRRLQLSLLGDVPVLSIRTEPLRRPLNRAVKRTFDILVSGLLLVTIYPIVWLIVGIIIKITSPGPILFRQKRTGKNGQSFTMLKFRSMKVNVDCDTVQASADDPRKTRFGNFLRHTNIDELPQLWNVFIGDMSLVGPRPHMLVQTEEYARLIDKYMMRHLVSPGITGWAQVTGYRGETREIEQMEGRVRRDMWYIENWSFLLDVRILFKTVVNMCRGEKNAV